MPAGTISLMNNSTAVAGAGTDFESELNANDFIVITVGGETYTLGVAAVVSGTALTLIRPFSGPTTSGIAWGVVPANTMVRIAAELAEQTTFALRANNIAKINWNAVFSESGDITVTLLDGSTFNGPSWKKIVDLLGELDVENLQKLVDQVHTDANQVAADRTAVTNAADQVNTDAQQVATDKTAVTNAATQVSLDKTAAEQAKNDAVSAKEAAEEAASTIDTSQLLKKDSNLSDLGNAGTARENLDVYSKEEVDEKAGGGGGYLAETIWHHSRIATGLPSGCLFADGQLLARSVYPELWALIQAGSVPVVTEANWQADATLRSAYTVGNGSSTFRIPDLNGATSGSIGSPFLRGDSGTANSKINLNAAPNITGTSSSRNLFTGSAVADILISASGSFVKSTVGGSNGNRIAMSSNTGTTFDSLNFDASQSNAVYGRDSATEIRPNAVTGAYIIRVASKASNPGTVDVVALASTVSANSNSIIAFSQRIGYALVTTSSNLALGSRMVLTNPFGASVPVMCFCEIYHATLLKWVTTPWIPATHGVLAAYSEGEGIVLRSASGSLVSATQYSGASQEFTANYVTPSPIRVHVFKVAS